MNSLLVNVLIFTFAVPGAAPSNVRANFTSSTSILVKWDEVPKDKRHGRIRYYNVTVSYTHLTLPTSDLV